MIGITARSLLLAVFWLGASCPLAASQLSAAKRVTAQQFGYDHTWRGPGTQGRPDQLFRRGLGSRSGFSEQAYSGRCYHCLGFCNYPGDPTRGPIRPRRLQRRRHRGHSYAGTGSLIHSVSSRRLSSSSSATAIDGIGPPRSRAAWRRAATNRSSESMVSISRNAAPSPEPRADEKGFPGAGPSRG
jgi:hypothetical protein